MLHNVQNQVTPTPAMEQRPPMKRKFDTTDFSAVDTELHMSLEKRMKISSVDEDDKVFQSFLDKMETRLFNFIFNSMVTKDSDKLRFGSNIHGVLPSDVDGLYVPQTYKEFIEMTDEEVRELLVFYEIVVLDPVMNRTRLMVEFGLPDKINRNKS